MGIRREKGIEGFRVGVLGGREREVGILVIVRESMTGFRESDGVLEW